MNASKMEHLRRIRKKKVHQIKNLQKTKYKKMTLMKKRIKQKNDESLQNSKWTDYGKGLEFAGNNFKNHMHRHTITWIIALVIFLVFVSTAIMFILRSIK